METTQSDIERAAVDARQTALEAHAVQHDKDIKAIFAEMRSIAGKLDDLLAAAETAKTTREAEQAKVQHLDERMGHVEAQGIRQSRMLWVSIGLSTLALAASLGLPPGKVWAVVSAFVAVL